MMRKLLLSLFMVLMSASVAAAACKNPLRKNIFIQPGFKTFPAPETPPEVPYLRPDGTSGTLADLEGKASIVTFWFPRCPGCQQEGPSLNAMLDRYKPQGGVNFLALSVQGEREEVVQYLARRGYESMEPNIDNRATLFRDLCFQATPVHLIMNADAKMVAVLVGPQDWEGENATILLEDLTTKGGI